MNHMHFEGKSHKFRNFAMLFSDVGYTTFAVNCNASFAANAIIAD